MTKTRLLIIAAILAAAGLAFWLDLYRFLSLDFLQSRLVYFETWVASHFVLSSFVFFLTYTTLAAANLPGAAAVLTLGSGALFGVVWGTVLSSFASSAGATLGCLTARFLLRDFVEHRFPKQTAKVNEGVRRDGGYYLFGLRLVPIFPYFMINMLMGLTRLPLRTFYWVSQLGMLPGTIVYVNAGTQLAKIQQASDVLSPGVAGSLALLGVFPLFAKKLANAVMAWHRKRM